MPHTVLDCNDHRFARCAQCQTDLTQKKAQCVTDCGHVFCLACACLHLGHQKHKCIVCQSAVRLVRQMDPNGHDAQREKPCHVKFCNITYILYDIYPLVRCTIIFMKPGLCRENARLIHNGKVLKKGDVWPGAIVQLVGTRKRASLPAPDTSGGSGGVKTLWTMALTFLCWLLELIGAPLRFLYLFFHSLIMGSEYRSLPQQRYAPVHAQAPALPPTRQNTTFPSPGQAAKPAETESV